MERSRDGRRSGNGVSRRRSRSSGLGESPEEDGGAGLQETVRLRSRDAKKDRDRERSGHNRRRRGERMMPESNRDEGDVMSDESVDEEEEDDDEERTSVRMPPPSNLSPTSSSMLHNPPHRRSTPTRTAKSPPVWRPADEMISVSIPRKARSAYAKRSHEGEHLHRHSSASTSPSREIKASAPPTSPSSANALIRNKTKPRPTKIAKSPSSIQEIEIEVAEVLFGLTRQIQEPSNKQENNNLNESTAPEILPPQNSTISSFSAIAPKRKRPRPLKIEEEQATSSARKNSGEEKTKTENPSPQPGKNSTTSPTDNGAEVSVNLKIVSVQDTNEGPSKIDQTIPSAAETNRTADKAQNLRCEERMEQERETVDAQKEEVPRSASKPEKAIPNPLDGRTTLLKTAQLLSKHCVTHCCIAKNIQYQQQIARIAPLYGLKPTTPSSAPLAPGPKSSPNEHIALQKKPPSQLPAPAFLFPVSQPHPAVAVKPPNPTLGSSSTASSDLNSPPVTFNYANLANSEAQYFLLQNAGYPFQLPAYRGGPHPQPLPFFNGSVFLHSSQLQPHQSNPNPAGYLTSHVESTQSQRQKSTAEDYPGSSHELPESTTAVEVNAPTGLAVSLAAAMSRPAGQRYPGFDDKKSTPTGGKASSRPEIDLTGEGSARTLNLIPCSSTNGPRAPPPNQRQLQFHQQQRHFQLQQQQQQQQQLQLHQQLAAQRGKTSTTADVNVGRMPPPPPTAGVAPLQWKTSSSSSSPVAIVAGRAPPQLSFGGGRSAAPPTQQSSLVPPMLGQRHAGPSPPPQLQKHQALPPGQLFFSNPYYQRPPPDHHVPAAPSTSSGTSGVRGLPPSSLLQAAQFAASSGAHTLMSAAGFPYLHAMPSVPVKPTEHKPAAGK